jgi:ribonuclease HI
LDSNDAVFAYTDGSYNPETRKAGHGVFFQPQSINNKSIRTSGHQSNQHAEIQAVLATLQMIPAAKPIHFITDSEYAINIVRRAKNWSKSKMAQAANRTTILQVLAELAKKPSNSVEMQWCKGHSTTLGNNEADALAAVAATLPAAPPPCPPPNTSFLTQEGQMVETSPQKFVLTEAFYQRIDDWKSMHLQGSFLLATGVDWSASNFFFKESNPIATLNMARKIRIGLAPTNAVLFRVNHPDISTDACPFCPTHPDHASIVDDNAHFLLHCQLSLSARIELRAKVTMLINDSIPRSHPQTQNVPFWFDAHQPNVSRSPLSSALQHFNKYDGVRGLIPTVLHKYLHSLGIKPSATPKIARKLNSIILQHSVDLVRYRTQLATSDAAMDTE